MEPNDLTVAPDGNDFILSVGKQNPVRLTPQNLLDLAQSAVAFRALILRQQSAKSGSAHAIVVTPVQALVAWTGAMQDSVLLSVQTARGEDLTLGLPINLAQKLLLEIPEQIQKIECQNRTQQ